ncbi:hypothetical protein Tco_1450432 [Tanacetum coccineum]
MPTPPPSPLTSLSPPSAGERLARCTAPSAHSSPPLVPSPLLPSSGCPTQIQTLRIASTQALVDAVTAALPSPPLPPLPPSLYIPPHVDRRDDIPESEQPPRKRSFLFALGSRYEVGESSTARPTDTEGDTWVDPAESVPEIAPMTVGEETVWIMEEEAYASREAWAHSIGLSQTVHHELQTHRDHIHSTMYMRLALRCSRQRWQSFERLTAELLALRGQQRARQPGPDARIPDDQDASGDADSHI